MARYELDQKCKKSDCSQILHVSSFDESSLKALMDERQHEHSAHVHHIIPEAYIVKRGSEATTLLSDLAKAAGGQES